MSCSLADHLSSSETLRRQLRHRSIDWRLRSFWFSIALVPCFLPTEPPALPQNPEQSAMIANQAAQASWPFLSLSRHPHPHTVGRTFQLCRQLTINSRFGWHIAGMWVGVFSRENPNVTGKMAFTFYLAIAVLAAAAWLGGQQPAASFASRTARSAGDCRGHPKPNSEPRCLVTHQICGEIQHRGVSCAFLPATALSILSVGEERLVSNNILRRSLPGRDKGRRGGTQ